MSYLGVIGVEFVVGILVIFGGEFNIKDIFIFIKVVIYFFGYIERGEVKS